MALVEARARSRTEQRVVMLVAEVGAISCEDRLGVMGGVDVPRRSNVEGLEWHLVRPQIAPRVWFLLEVSRNHLGVGLLWIGQIQAKWVDFEPLKEVNRYEQMLLRLSPHYQCWISRCVLHDSVRRLLRLASGIFVSVVVSLILMARHYFWLSL